jgi:hypothetical protein
MDPPLAETRDTSSLHGQHKIISDGKIIAVAAGKTKNSWLLTPRHRQRVRETSTDVQSSLKIRILHLGVFRWTNPNGGQNGGQTHSHTKGRGLLRSRLCVAVAALMPSAIAGVGRHSCSKSAADNYLQRYVTALGGMAA